jgi:3-hydroxybutyryl-CoA dehydratase
MVQRIHKDQVFLYPFSFNQNDVVSFAEASGDKNPLHLDEEYGRKSIFKRRILHGFLGGSIFSKVFGTVFPGEGTIYLKQNMSFLKPMFVNTDYTAKFSVLEVISEKNRALVKTEIIDELNNVIITGEALIQHKIIS